MRGSKGNVASESYNALMESFFGSMKIELLDSRAWVTRTELGTVIFERIEASYNPSEVTSASVITARPSSTRFTPPPHLRHYQLKQSVRESQDRSRYRRAFGGETSPATVGVFSHARFS